MDIEKAIVTSLFFIMILMLCYMGYIVFNYTYSPTYKVVNSQFNVSGCVRVHEISVNKDCPVVVCNNFDELLNFSGNSHIYYCVNNSVIKFMSRNNGIVFICVYRVNNKIYHIYDVVGNKIVLKKTKGYYYLVFILYELLCVVMILGEL